MCFYDFIIRAACVVATCFPAALKLRLFVCQSLACALFACVVCCASVFLATYVVRVLFFFLILRSTSERERVGRESERRRAQKLTTHKHKDREKNDDDER